MMCDLSGNIERQPHNNSSTQPKHNAKKQPKKQYFQAKSQRKLRHDLNNFGGSCYLQTEQKEFMKIMQGQPQQLIQIEEYEWIINKRKEKDDALIKEIILNKYAPRKARHKKKKCPKVKKVEAILSSFRRMIQYIFRQLYSNLIKRIFLKHEITCQSFLGSFIENESVDELIMRNLCHNYELAIIDSIMLSNKHQIFPVI